MKPKKGWDKHCGIYNCSDGPHFSWWQAIVRTPEWEAWYKYQQGKNQMYDTDESQECGWMGENHAKDFLRFVRLKYKTKGKDKMGEEFTDFLKTQGIKVITTK